MRTSPILIVLATLALSVAAAAQLPTPDIIWEASVRSVSITYSADGAHVVSAGWIPLGNHTYGRIDVFDAADGAVVAYRQSHSTAAILGRTNQVAISPDGQAAVSVHGGVACPAMTGCYAERPGLFKWTFPALSPLEGRTDLELTQTVDFAPNGERIAVGYYYDENQGRIRIHDFATLNEVTELPGNPPVTNDLAYSPDGSLLASVGWNNILRVRDVATGETLYSVTTGSYTVGGYPSSVAFSPDGTTIATGGDGFNLRVKVWDAATGTLLHDLDGGIGPNNQGVVRVAYTPNGMYLVGAMYQYSSGGPWQGRIRFWDADTGEIVKEYADIGPAPYHGGIRAIAFSEAENHRFAYVVGEIGIVKLAETDMNLRDDGGSTVGTESGPGDIVSLTVYPNPTSGSASVRLELSHPQVVRIDITDILGRRVGAIHHADVAGGGPVTLSLGTHDLPGGLYVVRIQGMTFQETSRLTVAR